MNPINNEERVGCLHELMRISQDCFHTYCASEGAHPDDEVLKRLAGLVARLREGAWKQVSAPTTAPEKPRAEEQPKPPRKTKRQRNAALCIPDTSAARSTQKQGACLAEAEVWHALELMGTGMRNGEVAAAIGCDPMTACRIRNGRLHHGRLRRRFFRLHPELKQAVLKRQKPGPPAKAAQ